MSLENLSVDQLRQLRRVIDDEIVRREAIDRQRDEIIAALAQRGYHVAATHIDLPRVAVACVPYFFRARFTTRRGDGAMLLGPCEGRDQAGWVEDMARRGGQPPYRLAVGYDMQQHDGIVQPIVPSADNTYWEGRVQRNVFLYVSQGS